MKRYLMKIFIIFCCFVCLYEAKINIRVTISDYANHENLMHNGNKCENFHWAGDHCDPMFKICVSGRYNCDLLYKSTRFWANKRYVYDILSSTIQSTDFQNIIRLKVDVDDHDRFDAHDHIGVFRATFYISQSNYDKQKYMDYGPRDLNIRLKARIQISCAPDFYGSTCDTYCLPRSNYQCSPYDGQKICSSFYYGSECNVHCIPNVYFSCSPKTGEKICKENCISQKSCVFSEYKKAFQCECYGNWHSFTCQAERLPYYSTSSTKKIKLLPTTKSPQTTKSLTSVKSIITSSLPIDINNLSKSTKHILVNKSVFSVSTSIIRQKNSKYSKDLNFFKTKTTITYLHEITKAISSTDYKKPNAPIKINNIKAASSNLKSLKNTDNENSSNQGNTGIVQVLYAIPVGLLAFLFLCLLLRYWKLKYKLKYLENSHTEEIFPPVVYRPNLQFRSLNEINPDENRNPYSSIGSIYDSCTLTTNVKDEVYYEEPIVKDNNNIKWQNNF